MIPSVTFNVLVIFAFSRLAYGLDTTNQSSIHTLVEDLRKEYDTKFDKCVTSVKELTERLNYQEKILESKWNSPEGSFKDELRNRRVLLHGGIAPDSPLVAFYTQLSKDTTGLGDFQTIVFDLVTTNIGDAYNHATGVFTAPVAGVYVFFWSTTNWGTSDHTQTEIVLNAVVKGRAMSDSGTHAYVSSATGSAVLNIDAGDTVWIRSNTVHSHNTIKGSLLSWFNGWLLY